MNIGLLFQAEKAHRLTCTHTLKLWNTLKTLFVLPMQPPETCIVQPTFAHWVSISYWMHTFPSGSLKYLSACLLNTPVCMFTLNTYISPDYWRCLFCFPFSLGVWLYSVSSGWDLLARWNASSPFQLWWGTWDPYAISTHRLYRRHTVEKPHHSRQEIYTFGRGDYFSGQWFLLCILTLFYFKQTHITVFLLWVKW